VDEKHDMLNMQAKIRLLLDIPDHPGVNCSFLLGRVAENQPLSVVENAESKMPARLAEVEAGEPTIAFGMR
jgi:hypothetical protein